MVASMERVIQKIELKEAKLKRLMTEFEVGMKYEEFTGRYERNVTSICYWKRGDIYYTIMKRLPPTAVVVPMQAAEDEKDEEMEECPQIPSIWTVDDKLRSIEHKLNRLVEDKLTGEEFYKAYKKLAKSKALWISHQIYHEMMNMMPWPPRRQY